MSMTDLAVFRNVKAQETVSVAAASNSIRMPRDGLILDVSLETMATGPRHEAVCPDGTKALRSSQCCAVHSPY
jgi:hypothetical protein